VEVGRARGGAGAVAVEGAVGVVVVAEELDVVVVRAGGFAFA